MFLCKRFAGICGSSGLASSGFLTDHTRLDPTVVLLFGLRRLFLGERQVLEQLEAYFEVIFGFRNQFLPLQAKGEIIVDVNFDF